MTCEPYVVTPLGRLINPPSAYLLSGIWYHPYDNTPSSLVIRRGLRAGAPSHPASNYNRYTKVPSIAPPRVFRSTLFIIMLVDPAICIDNFYIIVYNMGIRIDWRGPFMNKYGYDGPEKFRPLSPWGYVGYSLLFAIPLVGLIIVIVLSFSDGNINRRSYARSIFCWFIVGVVVTLILTVTGVGTAFISTIPSRIPTIR